MTYGVYARAQRAPRRNRAFALTSAGLLGSCIAGLGAVFGAGMLYVHIAGMNDEASAGDPANVAVAARWPDVFANIYDPHRNDYDPLRDASVSLGAPPTTFAERLPDPVTFHADGTAVGAIEAPAKPQVEPTVTLAVVETVPLPRARPSEPHIIANRGPSRPPLTTENVLAAAPPDQRNFLEKFFGINKPAGTQLAYASPDGGLSDVSVANVATRAGSPERNTTAIYDISAHTVYMPDGRRLEAHSGLGAALDDPNRVSERMHGATPPHVYALRLREALFHGVRALRLNPVGDGNVYGRSGLLAHTYMLGPNGDSNGCVSFKDYETFVRAYDRGEVTHLVVVPKLS
ncbi:MAG: DUF2778 domain-containing protein [Xanthobacteraceae bacterium]|nr:DUF2778 domain-containing protein [Xanthobacteraceae bacterium]